VLLLLLLLLLLPSLLMAVMTMKVRRMSGRELWPACQWDYRCFDARPTLPPSLLLLLPLHLLLLHVLLLISL